MNTNVTNRIFAHNFIILHIMNMTRNEAFQQHF